MDIDIPEAWQQIEVTELRGTLLILGGTDVGKSTFARFLFSKLCGQQKYVAYLDGDPGQSRFGPPTTVTLGLSQPGNDSFPPNGKIFRKFIGSVSPTGHMLPMVVATGRLVQAARNAGAEAIVHDTSGFIDPHRGGIYLKLAMIDLLLPETIFVLQREKELATLLQALRRSHRLRVHELPVSRLAKRRDLEQRRLHRQSRFADYFREARELHLMWSNLAVLPAPRFEIGQLVALEDAQGFVLSLGIVAEIRDHAREIVLRTRMSASDKVDAIRLGSLALDPPTYQERRLRVPG